MTAPGAPLLDELQAATAYARAWNRLDPTEFLALLAPDARYASQWVFEELHGRAAVSEYLAGKMRTVKAFSVGDPSHRVHAELGRTTTNIYGRDCVFLAQGKKDNITAVALFEIKNNLVGRFDLCIPQLLGVVRSGVYPI